MPTCKERPQIAICCSEWLGRLKSLTTGSDASLSLLSTSRWCSRNRSPSRLPMFHQYITFCKKLLYIGETSLTSALLIPRVS